MTHASQTFTPEDQNLLRELRTHRRRKPKAPPAEARTLGEKLADLVAGGVGSWAFISIQSGLLALWIALNATGALGEPWDPYPFILLNLMLSFQAAYTAPVILMSQNRQADVDRERAIDDYKVNLKAELEIELLHHKIDLLREQEIARLEKIISNLCARLDARPAKNE